MPPDSPRLIEPSPLVDPPPLDDDDLAAIALDPDQLDLDHDRSGAIARAMAWQVRSLDDAEWAMRTRSAIVDELAALQEQAEAWRQRVDAWLDQVSRPLVGRVAYLDDRLTTYQAARRAKDERRNKTLYLPSGEVRSRSVAPKVTLRVRDDDERLIAWAKQNAPAALDVKERVTVSKAREHVRVTARIVARSYVVLLSCSHREEARIDVDETGTLTDRPPDVGGEFHCHGCGETRGVVEVERTEDEVVFGLTGPGVDADLFGIDEGSVDYSVVPK